MWFLPSFLVAQHNAEGEAPGERGGLVNPRRPTVIVGGGRAAGESPSGKNTRDERGELGEVR